MSHSRSRPELLSPAGDWDCLRAAVANGADAVYFGLPQFNARHRATNFLPDELPDIIRFLHDRNVKGFVTLNTLVFSDELPAVCEYVRTIARCGADAVIVQDLGLVQLIKRLAPDLPIHASTQMTLTEPRGINFARRLGVERVVLARELSLDEIRRIVANTDTPVEVFVHGALCVAYSGQCLTSEALGGRSANRGQCAQACRLPYELIVDGVPRELGDRAYLLSPQDLAAHDLIDELTEAGAVCFKIEGRLKSAHYVAAATHTYRSAIDAAIERNQFSLSDREKRDLAQTFSRGFTPGFLNGVDHQNLVQGRFPKSRGVAIGKVTSVSHRSVRVDLSDSLFPLSPTLEQGSPVSPTRQQGQESNRGRIADIIKPGDGVVFDLGKPEENEPGGRVWGVNSMPNTNRVELLFEPGVFDHSSIPIGCTIWKTDDPALRKRLERSYAGDRASKRVPIFIEVSGRIGEPLQVRIRDEEGRADSVEWPGPLAAAQKHPLDRSTLLEQFDRLGDTPFELGGLEIDLPEAVMTPKSVLNDLRRQAVQKLKEMRQVRYRVAEGDALEQLRNEVRAAAPQAPKETSPKLSVLVRNLEQLGAVMTWRAVKNSLPAMIYCDFEDPRRYREAVRLAQGVGAPIGLATLRIIKPGEEGLLKPIANTEPDAILVRNLASLAFFKEALPAAELIGDFSMNVANEISANLLMAEGLARLVPSYDLNWEQLSALVQRSSPQWYEIVVHQHMPMFHMEHCVFAAFLSNGKDFRDCGRPCDRHQIELRDRSGAEFPVTPDTGCRNTVFNAVAQSAAEYLARMQLLGLRRFRVDLLRESPEKIGPLLDHYIRVLQGEEDGHEAWRELQALNQLGVTRGTLRLV